MGVTALGDQPEGDPADGPAGREFLPFTQRGPLLVDGAWPVDGWDVDVWPIGDQGHAPSVILQCRYLLPIR
jgi:hypothetical protein